MRKTTAQRAILACLLCSIHPFPAYGCSWSACQVRLLVGVFFSLGVPNLCKSVDHIQPSIPTRGQVIFLPSSTYSLHRLKTWKPVTIRSLVDSPLAVGRSIRREVCFSERVLLSSHTCVLFTLWRPTAKLQNSHPTPWARPPYALVVLTVLQPSWARPSYALAVLTALAVLS
jgi:hypothetical protein